MAGASVISLRELLREYSRVKTSLCTLPGRGGRTRGEPELDRDGDTLLTPIVIVKVLLALDGSLDRGEISFKRAAGWTVHDATAALKRIRVESSG